MLSTLLAITLDLHSMSAVSPTIGGLNANIQMQSGMTTNGLVLAQQFQSTDILGNLQTGWADFLQTGKAGALAVGLVMGYMVRGITR